MPAPQHVTKKMGHKEAAQLSSVQLDGVLLVENDFIQQTQQRDKVEVKYSKELAHLVDNLEAIAETSALMAGFAYAAITFVDNFEDETGDPNIDMANILFYILAILSLCTSLHCVVVSTLLTVQGPKHALYGDEIGHLNTDMQQNILKHSLSIMRREQQSLAMYTGFSTIAFVGSAAALVYQQFAASSVIPHLVLFLIIGFVCLSMSRVVFLLNLFSDAQHVDGKELTISSTFRYLSPCFRPKTERYDDNERNDDNNSMAAALLPSMTMNESMINPSMMGTGNNMSRINFNNNSMVGEGMGGHRPAAPVVVSMEILISGPLQQQKGSKMGWKSRFFALLSDSRLLTFPSEDVFNEWVSDDKNASYPGKPPLQLSQYKVKNVGSSMFQLDSMDGSARSWKFLAPSYLNREEWVSRIKTSIKNSSPY